MASADGLPDPGAVAADTTLSDGPDQADGFAPATTPERRPDHDDTIDADDSIAAASARRPASLAGPPDAGTHRAITGASGLVAQVRRMMFADRSTAPPTGRIRIAEGAAFSSATGCAADAFGGVTTSGDIVINGAMLDATPGLAARLERTVIARGHPTGVRALGDLIGTTTLRMVLREVFGGSGGIPARGPDPTGARAVELLAGATGFQAILDAYFQGDIGTVRDRLAERFGHGRAEAILDAGRTGQIADLERLMQPDAGGMVDTFGPTFTEAVRTGIAGSPDQPTPRRPSEHQRLAADIADAVGARHLRDAYL
ncbi:MAG: hypothetical protein KDB37_21800, partial [Ilumatobacter sp.]|nr:hypothetical protein [Ilumatobacter sp.]